MSELHAVLAALVLEDMRDPDRRSPALLNVARQLLKDNGINCVGDLNDTLKDIREQIPVFSAERDELI